MQRGQISPQWPAETSWQAVAGYDWRTIRAPQLGEWEPTRSTSVVIPAFECQEQLDRTLAALACQRYPSSLLEVVVADDGSATPLVLPDRAPEHTRILRLERNHEWGQARARHAGALAAEGEVLLFLDADMVAYPDHVAAHARWHHVVRDAVTLGHKLFVDFAGVTADDVHQAATEDRLFQLLSDRPSQPHLWVERLIERTDQLTVYRPKIFMAAVSATLAMRAELYHETGGFRTHLRAGEDMELAYRLMTVGAVFIPEGEARSWHQGPATYMARAAEVRRRNEPHFANFVPVPGATFRPWKPGRHYAVAMVRVAVTAADSFEDTQRCVDAVLAGDETDLIVDICGAAPGDTSDMLSAEYSADARVNLRESVPTTGFPSRFTVFMPPWAGLATGSLSTILRIMEESALGLLRVAISGSAPAEGELIVWRTAALHRALRAADRPEDVFAVAGQLFGMLGVAAEKVGVFDLRSTPPVDRPKQRRLASAAPQHLAGAQEELEDLRRRYRRLRVRYDELKERSSGDGAPVGGEPRGQSANTRQQPRRRFLG